MDTGLPYRSPARDFTRGEHAADNSLPIETFYAPSNDGENGMAYAQGDATPVSEWATHSLSAYNDDDVGYEVIRAQTTHADGRHPPPVAPPHGNSGARGRGSDTGVGFAFSSMERLAACVEGLSNRVDLVDGMNHTPLHDGPDRAAYRHDDPFYRDDRHHDQGGANDMRETIRDLEQRLLSVQDSFQDTVQSMSARMMLMQQRLTALEAAQV